MMDRAEMVRVINALPWPERTKPVLSLGMTPSQVHVVLLHEPHARGWADVAKIQGPTPERCFYFALERWMQVKGIDGPDFQAALRQLTN